MNIFSDIDPGENRNLRRIFINNILSTDMSNHMNDLKKLKDIVVNENTDFTKMENKEFIMSEVVHLSDISNPIKPFSVYKKWVDLLFVEFFSQVNFKSKLFREIKRKQ